MTRSIDLTSPRYVRKKCIFPHPKPPSLHLETSVDNDGQREQGNIHATRHDSGTPMYSLPDALVSYPTPTVPPH